MLEGIPCVRLSKERERACLSVMRTGNPLRDEWSMYLGPRQRRKFRNELFSFFNPKKTCEDKYKLSPGCVPNPFGCIPVFRMSDWKKDLPHIMAVRDVEWEMTCSYVRLAQKLATKWASFARSNLMVCDDDFGQEAWLTLRNAIYGYRKDVCFTTYSQHAIRNHMLNLITKGTPISYFSYLDQKLFREFTLRRNKATESVSLDQIANEMGLTNEQIARISAMLIKTINYSQIGPGADRDRLDEYDNDVTALRHNAHTDLTDAPEMCSLEPMLDKVKAAHLTAFEEEIFMTSLPGYQYYGWQTEIASRHVNPKTCKPYTRAGAAIALEIAYKKLRNVVKDDPYKGYNVRKVN